MFRVTVAAFARLLHARKKKMTPITEEQEMGFFEHLEEFRMMLIHCILAFAIAMIAAFAFSKQIFALMREPLEKAAAHEAEINGTAGNGTDPLEFINNLASLLLYGEPAQNTTAATGTAAQALATLKFMDVFSILLNIGMIGGLALSCPFVLYFASKFIAPALTEKEKKCVIPFCIAAMALFCGGCAFSFFWLIPISIQVMYHFVAMFGLKMTWIASDYYGFVTMMTLIVGAAFQFPLLVIILQYLEIVKTATLLRLWRHVLIGIMIGSLLITPLGDPVSLSVLTGILFLFYIAAVSIGGILVKTKQRRREREEAEYETQYAAAGKRDKVSEEKNDTAETAENEVSDEMKMEKEAANNGTDGEVDSEITGENDTAAAAENPPAETKTNDTGARDGDIKVLDDE